MPQRVYTEEEEGKGSRRAPKGHCMVYADVEGGGDQLTRFIVRTSFLKNPIFQRLLDEAACEYDFNYVFFALVLWL